MTDHPQNAQFSTIALTKRMAHHRARSGYNSMLRFLRPDSVVHANSSRAGRIVNGLSRRPLRPLTGSEWYGLACLWGELRAAIGARTVSRPAVVHVLYGEDLLFGLPHLLPADVRLVATFHQPAERFRALVRNLDVVRRLDAVIVLDDRNREYFESLLPGRVHSLRLGVDTDYWSPGPRDDGRRRCIMVGTHLRDFELLGAVMRSLIAEGFEWDIVTVSPQVSRLPVHPRVRIHRNITDLQLRELYRLADASLLPLRGASASNALLQSLACGTPVIATDVGGVRSYGEDSPAVRLAPSADGDAHAEAIREVTKQPSLRSAARTDALRYDWSRVAADHERLFAGVLQPD